MVRTELDWKSERAHPLNWVAIALAVVLVALYAATWLRTGEQEPLVFAVVLAGWIGVYFTRFWEPILYLVAAAVFGGSVVIDLLTGIPGVPFYWLMVATTVAFVALAVYLFATEETYR
jgi:hypothetical protein